MPTYDRNEWPLQLCKVKEAWGLALPAHGQGKAKGEGIIIAHPDTGWSNHPELLKGNRYWTDSGISKNFYGKFADLTTAEDPMSGMNKSHGTTTASLMLSDEGHPSQNPPNTDYPNYTEPLDKFVTGIAPKVEVIPLRVTDCVMLGSVTLDDSVNTYATLTAAIYYTLSLNTDMVGVMSISLGGLRSPSYLEEALKMARRKGVIICAAGGQAFNTYGFKEPIFPGRSAHAICPSGCFENLDPPAEAFYGSQVDITTPGWGVIVARTSGEPTFIITPPRNYFVDTNSNGTSYSTALTAGACALWQAYHGRANLIQTYGRPFLYDLFKTCLQYSSNIPAGWDTTNRGAGVLDVEALLKYPLPSPADVERTAVLNNWTSADWGSQSEWGKI